MVNSTHTKCTGKPKVHMQSSINAINQYVVDFHTKPRKIFTRNGMLQGGILSLQMSYTILKTLHGFTSNTAFLQLYYVFL